MKCCFWLSLRWNWSWCRDEMVKGSARPHTTSTYQRVLHAMPAKRLALHKLQDCVGGWVAVFCCTQQDTDPSHPLTKPDTFAFVISSRSQAPNPFPFPLSSNSHSCCSPPPIHSAALPPLVARVGSWCHESRGRMKGEKPLRGHRHCGTWKKRYLTGTATKTLSSLGPQWEPVAWFHVPEELPRIAVYVCERQCREEGRKWQTRICYWL